VRSQHGPYYPLADSSSLGVEENLLKKRRVKGMSYVGKNLNLKKDVFFVAYHDNDQIMGKLLGTGGSEKGKSYKPNKTAAMLLYLLRREENDNIPYQQFTQLINSKFAGIPPGRIDAFLNELAGKNMLDTDGTIVTKNADPLGVFTGPQIPWDNPIIPPDNTQAEVRGKHAYSRGYFFITFWR
jgi:hypothetical protein